MARPGLFAGSEREIPGHFSGGPLRFVQSCSEARRKVLRTPQYNVNQAGTRFSFDLRKLSSCAALTNNKDSIERRSVPCLPQPCTG